MSRLARSCRQKKVHDRFFLFLFGSDPGTHRLRRVEDRMSFAHGVGGPLRFRPRR